MTTTINKEQKNPNVPNLRFPEFEGEWHTKSINDLAVVIGGGTPDTTVKSYWDGEIQWFTPSEVGKNKYVDLSVRTITEEGLNNSSAKLLPRNTILLSSRATIGECSLSLRECATNQGFQSLVSKKCNVDFLYYLIQTKKKDLIRKSCGSTFLEISANEVRKIQVSVPSEVEQQNIAGLLSLLDERIATQNKIIEDLKQLKSAIAHKLLNDRMLLETRISLGEVCELKNGYAFRSSSYCTDGKYKILTIANVQGNRYISTEDCKSISYLPNDLQEHQILRDNDILISMTGNVGRVSLCSKGHYLLNQRVGLLVPKIKEIEFIFQVLATEHFEQSMIACGQGAAQMNIGKGDIDGYMLPFSCKSDNMNHIAKMLQAYDNCIDTNARLLEALILQKQCLLQQMFI